MQDRITINSYDSFLNELQVQRKQQESEPDLKVLLVFMANDDPETKLSWCPDCAKAKPIIEGALKDLSQSSIMYVFVGSRDEWKKNTNPFKLHELKVTNVPTMINLKTNSRLVESECFDAGKIRDLVNNSR